MENNKPMLQISVLAETLQCHQRTLRIWDKQNILKPARSPKNRRLYSLDDIEKGKLIKYMTTDLGINIVGIKIILELLPDLNTQEAKLAIESVIKDLNIETVEH